jgi:hypothetical protein
MTMPKIQKHKKDKPWLNRVGRINLVKSIKLDTQPAC